MAAKSYNIFHHLLFFLFFSFYFCLTEEREKKNTKACSKILSILESSFTSFTQVQNIVFFFCFLFNLLKKRGKYRGCFIPNKILFFLFYNISIRDIDIFITNLIIPNYLKYISRSFNVG